MPFKYNFYFLGYSWIKYSRAVTWQKLYSLPLFWWHFFKNLLLLGGSDGKESAYNSGDLGSIPGLGRSPGEGHGNPLQYSCLENPCGQRSLAGNSLWCHKESDMTDWLSKVQYGNLWGKILVSCDYYAVWLKSTALIVLEQLIFPGAEMSLQWDLWGRVLLSAWERAGPILGSKCREH